MDAEHAETIQDEMPPQRVSLLRQWFVRHHGEGEAHQYDIYRCDLCRRLVTHRMIREQGGCGSCAGARMRPTNATLWEAFRLLVLPWLK